MPNTIALKRLSVTILLIVIFFIAYTCAAKDASGEFKLHCDLPYVFRDKLLLDAHIIADSSFKGILNVAMIRYVGNDSITVLRKKYLLCKLKQGINKIKVNLSKEDTNTFYSVKFFEVLKRAENVAPGKYKIYLSLKHDSTTTSMSYLYNIDSTLSPVSPLRHEINKSATSNSFWKKRLQNVADKSTAGAGQALTHAKSKVDRAVKRAGLTSIHYEKNGKSFVDLYYQDWFAGRYMVDNNSSLSKQIGHQEDIASSTNFNGITNNDLDHPSLFSQYKNVSRQKKDDKSIKGDIGLTTNLSTGQEQYSGIDNNWYELRGRVELPIDNLPVELEGLYTSQDAHREVKSSYFHVHYSVAALKHELSNSISSYNTKFAQTQSKATGMETIYSAAIGRLESQRAALLQQADSKRSSQSAANFSDDKMLNELRDTSALKTELAERADSSEDVKEAGQKKRQIEELDKKIAHYKTLLEQNKNTNFFDSAIAYSKTKDLNTTNALSYKQLSKKGAELLPDGKAKSFVSGITTMDAGVFSKEQSRYTMAGQMVKGADFGYDLGFCETGVSAGKTEYVGRDGNLDKYTFYSGRASFRPQRSHKVSFIYYGYSADKTYTGTDFFKQASVAAPSFFQPVHIFSTVYDAAITNWLKAEAEVATSMKKSDDHDIPAVQQQDKMACHFVADANIPNTSLVLQGAYDNTGKSFENSTLPFSLKGTEQYRASVRNDFFRSLLTAGVEFDQLVQNNFSSSSRNTKWGFDVKTNFRRYPNAAVSYKPFTTFHLHTDTLSIPQRPLIGSVWTAKATWQIRKHDHSWNFCMLYNKSATTMDSSAYSNSLFQYLTTYTDKRVTTMLSVGRTAFTGTSTSVLQTAPNDTKFLSGSLNYSLNKMLSLSGGQDIGTATFGLCKYGANAGAACRFEKVPIMLRVNMRYMTYKLMEGQKWKDLYSGAVDLVYSFRIKTDKK